MGVCLVPIKKGRTIAIDKAVVFIGRHPECDIVLTRSRKVSRKHCCLAQVNDRYLIRDLGSTNGVRVNGVPVESEAPLKLGDEVAIGDVRYVVQIEDPKPRRKKSNGDARETVAASPQKNSAKPAAPLNLSQEVPVAIPEDGDSFQVESSSHDALDAVPVDADGGSPGSSDDAIPLSDSDFFEIDDS